MSQDGHTTEEASGRADIRREAGDSFEHIPGGDVVRRGEMVLREEPENHGATGHGAADHASLKHGSSHDGCAGPRFAGPHPIDEGAVVPAANMAFDEGASSDAEKPDEWRAMMALLLPLEVLALPDIRLDKIAIVQSALANGSYHIQTSQLASKVLDSMVESMKYGAEDHAVPDAGQSAEGLPD